MSTTQEASEKVVSLGDLPASVVVGFGEDDEGNPIEIEAPFKVSNAGNIWYEAVQEGEIEDGTSIEDALLGDLTPTFMGEELNPARKNVGEDGLLQLVISEPRKYEKGHEKEGQVVPNTGGNLTISYIRKLPTWGDGPAGYMLRVTLTGVEKDNGTRSVVVKVACQTAIKGKAKRVVGTMTGKLKFG